MPSSVASGAIYGTGVYGTSLYNVVNITVLVDGVVGTSALNDTLQIEGDATHVISSLSLGALSGSVGSVSIQAEAIVIPTGVSASGSINSVDIQTDAILIPTGVSATGSIGPVSIQAEAIVTLDGAVGAFVTGFIGSVGIQTDAVLIPTGVSATGSLGSLTQITVNRISVTGAAGTGEVGTAGLETNNYIDVAGFALSSFVNDALSITGKAVTVLPGVVITSTLNNTLNILENEVVIPPSVSAIIALGTVTINTTFFDYNSVASLYSRTRAVYIPRQTTSKERTVIVPAD